jgi:hypothetical protein
VTFETVVTNDHNTSEAIRRQTAGIGHRDAFEKSKEDRCAVRLRLTPSQPRQVSSIWYRERLPVLQGFETRFTFQITDQSRRCYEVKDQNFGVRQHTTCLVHGGDGFAFVVHSHPNKTETVGSKEYIYQGEQKRRSQMGYENIENSLAIEFDTWYNPEQRDTFYDHVSINSNGRSANSVGKDARISITALHELADGNIHIVKIRYYNELKYEYLPYFSSTANTIKFIKDVSEGRRVGTLLVFIDEGIEKDIPLLAIPINLAATLRMDSDEAFVVHKY